MKPLRLSRLFASVVAVAGLSLLAQVALGGPIQVGIERWGVQWGLYIDLFGAVLVTFIGFLVWVVSSYAVTNLRGQARLGRFGALVGAVLVTLVVMVTGANLILVAVGWTTSGILIGELLRHAGTAAADRAARYARSRLLIGDVGLWTAVVIALAFLPTVNRATLQPGPAWATGVVLAGIIWAGAARSSLAPWHRWLPETAEAPSPVSALLHAGVVNGMGILVLLCWPLFAPNRWALLTLVIVGLISIVVGTLAARVRADVKGQLACSTTAQMGYMALQLGLGLPAAALLHLLGHGCYKAWLFLRAGGAISRLRTRPSATRPATTTRATRSGRTGSPAESGRTGRVLLILAAGAPTWTALTALVVAVTVGAPALGALLAVHGPVAWVPATLALTAAALGGHAVHREVGSVAHKALVSIAAGAAAAIYLWMLWGWEQLLDSTLASTRAWSEQAMWLLTVAVAITLTAVAALAVRVRPTTPTPLATLLTRTAVSPWAARPGSRGARAAWPHLQDATTHPGSDPARHAQQDPLVPVRPGPRPSTVAPDTVAELVRIASAVTSPAFPLREMVAANPLADLEVLDFADALAVLESLEEGSVHLTVGHYLELYDTGLITEGALDAALNEVQPMPQLGEAPGHTTMTAGTSTAAFVSESRRRTSPTPHPRPRSGSTSDTRPGSGSGSGTEPFPVSRMSEGAVFRPRRWTSRMPMPGIVDEHASIWCQRAWSYAGNDDLTGPWSLWRESATHRIYDTAIGVADASTWVSQLPTEPGEAIAVCLNTIGMEPTLAMHHISRTVFTASGWASHAKWRSRRAGSMRPILELVALRLALDALFTGANWVGEPINLLPSGQDPSNGAAFNGSARSADRVAWHGTNGHGNFGDPNVSGTPAGPGREPMGGTDARYIWQLAHERTTHDALARQLQEVAETQHASPQQPHAAGSPVIPETPSETTAETSAMSGRDQPRRLAQMLFCIDVRSEPMRRALEEHDVETFGFAGFFGAAVRYRDQTGQTFELCPAILEPTCLVSSATPERVSLSAMAHRAAVRVSSAPILPLIIAEGAGILSGLASASSNLAPARWMRTYQRFVRRTPDWGPRRLAQRFGTDVPTTDVPADPGRSALPHSRQHLPTGMTRRERAELARGVLSTIGLVDHFAELIVISGHRSSVQNNAHASAYECGACGGNSGHINARILADTLNDPVVRLDLELAGIHLSRHTRAVAAIHDTTTSTLTLDPAVGVPGTHTRQLEHLNNILAAAAAAAGTAPHSRPLPSRAPARRRSVDWAEPTPEWGLAGNSAIVIGPRELTAPLNLDGRVFLHSYNHRLDPSREALKQLLTGPAVVAQWINAQYFFSTASPTRYGAGDKTTHNVIGDIGVVSGAHGDLRLGLPWQAVFQTDPRHSPSTPVHDPLRLMVLVAAPPEDVLAVVANERTLRQLVDNRWIKLRCLDPDTNELTDLAPGLALTSPTSRRPPALTAAMAPQNHVE